MSSSQTDNRRWAHEPEIVLHPGETLRERLQEIGMTPAELADRTGMPPELVDRIISGEEMIYPEISPMLEAATGTPSQVWDNLHVAYIDHRLRQGLGWPP